MLLQNSMNILSGVFSVYLMLIMVRVLLSWFRFSSAGRIVELLSMVTDPYLNIFRKIKWLRFGMMDFSPVLGLVLLNVLINITSAVSQVGMITLGLILAFLMAGLWSAMDFFFKFLLVLSVVRLVSTLFHPTSYIWNSIDMILRPITQMINNLLKKAINYQITLGVSSLLFLVFIYFGGKLFTYISYALLNLPF